MCDYSLMALPNRLAVCGEKLIVHRFEAGVIGLAPAAEVRSHQASATFARGFLAWLKEFLNPPLLQQCTAVCVPPGARLMVHDISPKLQDELGISVDTQEVVFTETSLTSSFRDAIRFSSGKEVLLQSLEVGQRVRVLSVSADEEVQPQLELGDLSRV